MNNWNGGCGYGNGAGSNWLGFGGGGLMMLLIVVCLVFLVYHFVKNANRNQQTGSSSHYTYNTSNTPGTQKSLSEMTDSELEAELKSRQSAVSLESEIADLKKQLAELKDEKNKL